VAGIGFKALASSALSNAASDARAAGRWLGKLDLVHALLLAACIALAVDHIALLMSHRHSAKVEAQLLVTNKSLTMSRANEATLRAAITDQNKRIAALGQQSAQQQKQAAQASQASQERAREAEATAQRLRAGTRSAGSQRAPVACEPSDQLKRQWK
jgi:hypothetical protein